MSLFCSKKVNQTAKLISLSEKEGFLLFFSTISQNNKIQQVGKVCKC